MHKVSFKRENYITDTVGHTNTRINIDDFNKKFRDWEIRRGFRESDTVPVLRGICHSRSKKKTS